MKTKKINRGLYEFVSDGRTFQVENINTASDGEVPTAWMLYEINKHGEREFWNDFATKRQALKSFA